MDTSQISAAQSKWARTSLGSLSQAEIAKLATKARKQISLSRLKVFEAGYFRPSEEFARDLRELYESLGVDFRDFVPPAAPAEPSPGGAPVPQVGRRSCFYLDAALCDAEAQRWFDAIEENQARMHDLYEKQLVLDRDGALKDESLDLQHELLNCLALDSLMLRMLIGSNPVRPRELDRSTARKLRDAVADFFHRNTQTQDTDEADDEADDEAIEEGEPA